MRPADETTLARSLRFKGEFADLPDHHFVLHMSGHIKAGVPIKFPPPSLTTISDGEYWELRRRSREQYGIKTEPATSEPPPKIDQPETAPEDPPPANWTP